MLKRWVLALCVVLGVAVSVAVPVVFASRNSAGTYSLPSGTTVSAGQTITPTWANTFTADVATELTNSLDRTGRGAMSQPLQLSNGSATAPSLTFASDSNTGLYRIGADNMGLALGGTKYLDFSTTTPLAVTGNATVSGTLGVTGVQTNAGGITANQSAANSSAITTTGNGSGAGIAGVGGASGGSGGSFTCNGSATNCDAVTATGKGTGAGVSATSGATGTAAILGTGVGSAVGIQGQGGPTGFGGKFTPGASTSTAIRSEGNIQMVGTSPASTSGFTNVLTNTAFVKAWAHLTGTGGSWAVSEGFNIASVSCAANQVLVNLATAMNSSTTYLTVVNGDTAVSNGTWMKANPNASASQVKILNYSCTGGAGCTVSQENLCTATGTIHLLVLGAQ